MPQTIDADRFLHELLQLLEETFETHHGIFLDRGTSLFETLAGIDAAQASRVMGRGGATVAAHIRHVDFYLDVLERFLVSRDTSPADWRAIWDAPGTVTKDEWQALQDQLRASYVRIGTVLRGIPDWNDGDTLSGAMGIVVHTASHLAAIRQGIRGLEPA